MNIVQNYTPSTTISLGIQAQNTAAYNLEAPQGSVTTKVPPSTLWPASNIAAQAQKTLYMPQSEQISLQSTETPVSESFQRRQTTAGQLLDSLTDNNKEGDRESQVDTVTCNVSETSKDNAVGYTCPHRGCFKTFSRKSRLNAHLQLHYGT